MAIAGSAQVTVFRSSKHAVGLKRGDSIVAQPVYSKLGVQTFDGNFTPDKLSPSGYAMVLDGRNWNVIDTCGNRLLERPGKTAPYRIGACFLYKTSDNKNIIADMSGNEIVQCDYLTTLKIPAGLEGAFLQNFLGYQIGSYDAEGGFHIKLLDGALQPVAGFEANAVLSNFGGQIVETLYDADKKQRGMVFRTPNGVETARFETPVYFAEYYDVMPQSNFDDIKKLYGYPPYFYLVTTSEKDKADLYFLDNKLAEGLPLKDVSKPALTIKKVWNKIKGRVLDAELAAYHRRVYLEPAHRLAARNQACEDSAHIEAVPVTIADVDGKRVFMRGNSPAAYNPTAYEEIDSIDRAPGIYMTFDGSKFRITDSRGYIMTAAYDLMLRQAITMRNLPVWLASRDGGKRLVTSYGSVMSKLYDDIIPVQTGNALHGYYFTNDDKWAYVPYNKVNEPVFYDYITEFDGNGHADVFYNGFSGTIDLQGNKVKDLCAGLFDEGGDSSKPAAERVAIYNTVIEMATQTGELEYTAPSYMNIAGLYEQAGDIDRAISNYEMAEVCGAKDAASNAKRLKNERLVNTLEQVAGALNNIATALGGNPADYDISGSYGAASMAGGTAGSSLESQYRNWERRAKSIYESLTNTGHKTRDRDGKDNGGSTGQGTSAGNFMAQKRLLRDAQSQMQSIRRKAAQQNITITKSEYESVNVNY